MAFIKLGSDDYVDPEEVEMFYNEFRDTYTYVKVFMKSGAVTYIKNMTLDEVYDVLSEARGYF